MISDKFELVFLTFFLITNFFIFFNFYFLKDNIKLDKPDNMLKKHKKNVFIRWNDFNI